MKNAISDLEIEIIKELRENNFSQDYKFGDNSDILNKFLEIIKYGGIEQSYFALYLIPFIQGFDKYSYKLLASINENENASKTYAKYIITDLLDYEVSWGALSEKILSIRALAEARNILHNCMRMSENLPKNSNEFSSSNYLRKTKSMTIIVHGSWGVASTWWQKNSPFWNFINQQTGDLYCGNDPYYWTGKNSDFERKVAAEKLKDWIIRNPVDELNVIAHSHGGNICLLATQYDIKINNLFLLGTPIRCEYLPNLDKIEKIYNIFSTVDFTQLIGTFPNCRFEGRTLGDSQKVSNFRAVDNGRGNNPSHSDLCSEETWKASKIIGLL